jgi:uncharacterized protein (TIGR02145 family)
MTKIIILSLLFTAFAKCYSQDYLISFAGEGESTYINYVKVENITQDKSILLYGTDQLRLKSVVSGSRYISNGTERVLRIYPNPAKEYSIIEFDVLTSGSTTVEIFDLSGVILAHLENYLTKGKHSYSISGIGSGVLYIGVKTADYYYTGKIISLSEKKRNIQIKYNGNSGKIESEIAKKLKDSQTEIIMQYNTGDRLKFKAISGIYSTIVMDVPAESKTITFTFIGCTDGDNNNYPVITIGNQTWMAENLRTTKYNDNTTIQLLTDNLIWTSISTPAYCWYNNDAVYKNTYGALYNWYALSTTTNGGKNVCPSGWHVPSSDEWATLIGSVGGINVASSNLTETGTDHCLGSGTTATNESGFTALPGGWRHGFDGNFYYLGSFGSWWSTTELDSQYVYNLSISCNDIFVQWGMNLKKRGLSVRCLMD